MGLSRSPRTNWHIIKNLSKEWRDVDRRTLRRVLREFKYDRLVNFKDEDDGTVSIVINERGKRFAMRYNPDQIEMAKPVRWDKKWRIVVFDIPEKKRTARDALRKKLKKLGFYELQKSTWVFPYECSNEINFLAEFFEVQQHVRVLTVEKMSMDADLKLHFDLS
ncbi:MAG: CRISPR-associated endonuclease Cas2 [Candidatus Niyogibacteria bacterium]|nr:MAG: CRISPR-associated endonuclease Cas2 [Candidatus Niyogibacteria bacterium]